MKAEEGSIEGNKRKTPTIEELRKKNRFIGIVLVSLFFFTILCILYALIQQTEAKKQTALAMKIMEESIGIKKENEQLKIKLVETQGALKSEKQINEATSQSSKK